MSTDATTTDGFRVGRRVMICDHESSHYGKEGRINAETSHPNVWYVAIEGYRPQFRESDLALLPDDAPATPEPERPSLTEGFRKLREVAGDRWAGVDVREYVREVRGETPEPAPAHDPVDHPKHYTSHPSGIECIQVTRHMNFNVGNAVKYLWRADLKGNSIEDLRKAAWYINDEIEKRLKSTPTT